jgi:hypothetical protein
MLIGFDGAKIHFFSDIPAVSAEILALRGWEGEKKRAASVRRGFQGAALLGLITSQGGCPPVTEAPHPYTQLRATLSSRFAPIAAILLVGFSVLRVYPCLSAGIATSSDGLLAQVYVFRLY